MSHTELESVCILVRDRVLVDGTLLCSIPETLYQRDDALSTKPVMLI